MSADSRIPVVFGQQPGAQDVVLAEEGVAVAPALHVRRFTAALPGHLAGCACCVPRGAGGEALAKLFRDRATGAVPYFSRVVVLASPAGRGAIRAALEDDALTRARYRLG